MKKLLISLFTFLIIMTVSVHAQGGIFDGYWDFEQADGTYAYGFPRVLVTMDKMWYQKTRVVLGEGESTASFYHKDSYNAYADEGLDGGLLFTIGASVNTDFQNLPSFIYIGFDEEEAMNYYAVLPTDYQAYMGDEAIRAEYDELWSGVEDVIAGIRIKGSAPYNEINLNSDTALSDRIRETEAAPDAEPDETEPEIITSGDFAYWINPDETAVIAEYTGDEQEIEIPSEIDGHRVSEIGYQAFTYKEMKSLVFPDGILIIGPRSFEYCVISDQLQLPENVTISNDAFAYAQLPASVTIPAGTTVGESAFGYCEIMEQVVVEADALIRSRAFGYCYDLKQVICEEGSRLESEAFEYCDELSSVIFSGTVEAEDDAFSYCGDIVFGDSVPQAPVDQTEVEKEPEEMTLEILNSPAEQNNVKVTLEKATAGRSENGGFRYTLAGSIENNSDEGMMQVGYTFAFIDENGEEFRSFGLIYDGEDTAIPPHSKVEFFHDDIRWGPQSVPAAVSLGIGTVKTETELPPAHIPKAGDYLYQTLDNEKLAKIKEEPPVEISFHIDQGGYGRTATLKTGEALDRAVELLCEIRIEEEANEWVTDNYNWIDLVWEDGSDTFISLNLANLEYFIHSSPHTYRLENLSAFWDYMSGYLQED